MHDEQPGDREAAGAIEGMVETYGAPRQPVTEGIPLDLDDVAVQFDSLAKAEQGAKDERHDFCARVFPHGTPGIPLDLLVTDPTELD